MAKPRKQPGTRAERRRQRLTRKGGAPSPVQVLAGDAADMGISEVAHRRDDGSLARRQAKQLGLPARARQRKHDRRRRQIRTEARVRIIVDRATYSAAQALEQFGARLRLNCGFGQGIEPRL